MPRQNSTCAPSGWRVRSPTQTRWAEVSYQRPEVEIDARHRLLEAEQQRLVRGVERGPLDLGRGRVGHAAGLHEGQRLGDPVGHIAVALALGERSTKPSIQLCTRVSAA